MKTLGGDKPIMLGDLMLDKLYPMVPVTPFAGPAALVLNITPTANYTQLALYEHEHKEKLRVFLNFKNFREVLEK